MTDYFALASDLARDAGERHVVTPMAQIAEPVWTLDEALVLIRQLQPQLKPLACHVALGGGVLNTGHSDKDLDLYILGFASEPGDIAAVLAFLGSVFGEATPIGENVPGYPPDARYRERLKFVFMGRRIDVFVQ